MHPPEGGERGGRVFLVPDPLIAKIKWDASALSYASGGAALSIRLPGLTPPS